jgi:hypothetical protein
MYSPSQDNYKSDILAELHPEDIETKPEYSSDEIEYIGGLKTRLQRAYNQRNQNRSEFDGMTYQQYWEASERGANTILQPKTNREFNFQSGTHPAEDSFPLGRSYQPPLIRRHSRVRFQRDRDQRTS